MLEFVINKYITLKLENGKTYIYILGKKFEQYKKLALTIVNNEFEILDELKSIDEIDNYKKLSSEERFPIQIKMNLLLKIYCSKKHYLINIVIRVVVLAYILYFDTISLFNFRIRIEINSFVSGKT
jgi:hypothetical protein